VPSVAASSGAGNRLGVAVAVAWPSSPWVAGRSSRGTGSSPTTAPPAGRPSGVLGKGTPEQAAAAILHAAAPYAAYCRPVQPAMELIANVAQAHAGADGTYSYRLPDATIASYLAAARRHKMLLLLDVQPGRADFGMTAALVFDFDPADNGSVQNNQDNEDHGDNGEQDSPSQD